MAANDPLDADTGPNGLQNYPVLTSVRSTSGNVNITGSLESKPSTTYELEFFGNDAVDPSGFGEGRTFLGATNVTTNASGHADFEVSYPLLAGALRSDRDRDRSVRQHLRVFRLARATAKHFHPARYPDRR